MNQVNIMGMVGKDPEVVNFQGGDKIVKLSIATTERWRDKTTGEKREQTEWHDIVFRDSVASIVESHVRKGDKIRVRGQLKTSSWGEGAEKKYRTEIIVGNRGEFSFESSKTKNTDNED